MTLLTLLVLSGCGSEEYNIQRTVKACPNKEYISGRCVNATAIINYRNDTPKYINKFVWYLGNDSVTQDNLNIPCIKDGVCNGKDNANVIWSIKICKTNTDCEIFQKRHEETLNLK
jgi:hypothetical protein